MTVFFKWVFPISASKDSKQDLILSELLTKVVKCASELR
jgi:hypothetical protein